MNYCQKKHYNHKYLLKNTITNTVQNDVYANKWRSNLNSAILQTITQTDWQVCCCCIHASIVHSPQCHWIRFWPSWCVKIINILLKTWPLVISLSRIAVPDTIESDIICNVASTVAGVTVLTFITVTDIVHMFLTIFIDFPFLFPFHSSGLLTWLYDQLNSYQ